MYQRTQPLFFRFITRCVQLFLRQRHPSALPNALRGKNLDYIRARRFLLPDERANLFRQPGLFSMSKERFHRRQDSRPRQFSRRDGIPQRNIVCCSRTLNRRESLHQRHPSIRSRLIRILLGRPSHPRILPVLPEVPGDVRGVDGDRLEL